MRRDAYNSFVLTCFECLTDEDVEVMQQVEGPEVATDPFDLPSMEEPKQQKPKSRSGKGDELKHSCSVLQHIHSS